MAFESWDFIRDFVDAFPELDSDDDLNGSDAVDRIAALRERAKLLLEQE